MRRTTDVPDEIKRRLQSGNPVSRGTAIFELATRGYNSPELVEPLANDKAPFMFGMPVLAPANAYLAVTSGANYDGPYGDLVLKIASGMREEWGMRNNSREDDGA